MTIPVFKGALPNTTMYKSKTKPPSHFSSLKPKFSHSRKRFDIDELEELFGEEVIYLPNMGKMILKSTQTIQSLQFICNFYGLYVGSSSIDKVFNCIREYCKGQEVQSPRVVDYKFEDLEVLFQSEVKMLNGQIVVYKDTSKKELDTLVYGRATKKTKRSLFDSIPCENPRGTSYTIRALCTLVGTKVLHCENRLLTYKSTTVADMRNILVRLGQSVHGDKKTLYGRLIGSLESRQP